jgi:outer membrane protein, heavy metal efflux system
MRVRRSGLVRIESLALCIAVSATVSVAAQSQSASPSQTVGPGQALTLADAIARAVANHPLLAAHQLEVRAREADAAQAAKRLNPTMTSEIEDLGRSSVSSVPSQTTISITQRFELGNKQALRTGLADLERDNAEWELAVVRADIVGRVSSAFLSVLVADAQLALARVDAETADEIAATVRARVDAGVAAPPEGDRADAAAASARIAVTRVTDTRRAALIALASTWGGPLPDDIALSGSIETAAAVPPFASLEEQLQRSPAIARWATEQARRVQATALARAERIPDLDLGGGYRRLHDSSANAFVVGATVALPLFDRRTDAVTAAQLRADGAKAETAAALNAARELLATAHSTATAAATALAELDQRVIPPSQRAYDAILEGYRVGRFPLVDVLDARRALTAARRDRVATLSDLQQALVTLQRLLGAPSGGPGTAALGERR